MESKCHFVANLPVRPKTQCKGFEAGLARLTTLKISHGFTSAEFATCCQFRAGSSFVLSCSHNTNDHPAISLFFSRWSCQSLQTALPKQGIWDPHRASQEYHRAIFQLSTLGQQILTCAKILSVSHCNILIPGMHTSSESGISQQCWSWALLCHGYP